ncbi:hypothetical protein IM043_gp097 [Bacillus phage SPG24]|nr:hypothetical protein IM043_gp097 [Bacillus phage SPG24]
MSPFSIVLPYLCYTKDILDRKGVSLC